MGILDLDAKHNLSKDEVDKLHKLLPIPETDSEFMDEVN